MKANVFITFMVFCSFSIFSQENDIESPLQYPFEETGVELPRGVYGSDDRKEVKDAEGIKDFVRATAVMINKADIVGDKVYGYTLREILSYRFKSANFDDNIKFLDQPTSANCTGFLIAPDILVTAGHCIKELEDAKDFVWVFDYTNELKYHKTFKYIQLDLNNVFEVVEVIGAYFVDGEYNDYSVLRLNRKSSRAPYRFRTSGKVGLNTKVNTIGSPTGLPLKYADNAKVVNDSQAKWFKNSIDTFPGNSGGPVFNTNGFIEGIHVRGAVTQAQSGAYTGDYKFDSDCNCIKTVEFESTLFNAGAQAHRINSIPHDLLHEAIYENLEYAIVNNLKDRFNSWMAYSWIVDHDYTKNRGRLEIIAARNNNLNALKTIISKSNNESLDIHGYDLLIHAINNDNLEMINFLIDQGISFESLDSGAQSPLFYAMGKDKFNLVSTMLDNGWDINSLDKNGNNLLHLAAYKNNFSLIKQIANKGVSASKKNNKGKRPEDIAKNKKNKKAKKYLKKIRKKRR